MVLSAGTTVDSGAVLSLQFINLTPLATYTITVHSAPVEGADGYGVWRM